MNPSQYKVMDYLSLQQGTYAEISMATELTVATVGQITKQCVELGWCTTERDERRRMVVYITAFGRVATGEQAARPSVGHVIAEARKLCKRAAEELSANPYAKVYAPSDAVARKVSQIHGPEKAIKILQERAQQTRHEQHTDDHEGERARLRHERRQRDAHRDREAELAGKTLGRRLDDVLLGLAVLQTTPAARMDTDVVRDGGGGKDNKNPVPRMNDDTAAKARTDAHKLVRNLELQLQSARRRLMDFERVG